MELINKLKENLGDKYIFEQTVPEDLIEETMNTVICTGEIITVAALTAGCVKIEAAIYERDGAAQMNYDIYVKDSSNWIFYDSLNDNATTNEAEMLAALDKAVRENGLSYTECCFEQIDGAAPADVKLAM